MHIALADSSPGDRKQMERLLSRESDRRVNSTGVFYIETFGSSGALLCSPTVYDVYFLDVTETVNGSVDIANCLRRKGIKSPVVFCVSKVDYRNQDELPENIRFIDKPIKTDELTALMEDLIGQKAQEHIPTIEFRNNRESFYLEEKEIAFIVGRRYAVDITLNDGSRKEATGYIENVWDNLKGYKSFVPVNKKTIVNKSYIDRISGYRCFMRDGTVIRIGFQFKKFIK